MTRLAGRLYRDLGLRGGSRKCCPETGLRIAGEKNGFQRLFFRCSFDDAALERFDRRTDSVDGAF